MTIKDMEAVVARMRHQASVGHGLDTQQTLAVAMLLESLDAFVGCYPEDHGDERDTVDDRLCRLVEKLIPLSERQAMGHPSVLPWDEPPECLGETQGA